MEETSIELQMNRRLGSFIVSLVLSIQFINTLLVAMTHSSDGYIPLIFGIIGVLMAIYTIITLYRKKWRITKNKWQFLITTLIVGGYALTIIFAGEKTNITTLEFVCRCFLPFLCGIMVDFNPKQVLKLMMVYLLLCLPYISIIFAKANVGSYDAVTMGTTYAILPVVSAGILHFAFFKSDATIFEKILYVVSFVYCGFFIVMSYRGGLFSLILLIAAIFICKLKKISIKFIVAIFLLSILLIIFYLFNDSLISAILQIFSSLNIKIATIDKSLALSNESNLLHGRLEIFKAALSGIAQSPLFGHGFSTFRYYTGYVYPHNIILQISFDCGVPVAVIMVLFIFKNIFVKIKYYCGENSQYLAFLLLIIFSSIPRVMVSAEIWLVIILWYLIGFLCRNAKINENNTDVEYNMELLK